MSKGGKEQPKSNPERIAPEPSPAGVRLLAMETTKLHLHGNNTVNRSYNMGSFLSSRRVFSFRYEPSRYERRRGSSGSRGSRLTPKQKRSSMNRPVLRLQIKQETLERQRRLALLNGTTVKGVTRESGAYDHLVPQPKRSASAPTLALHHTRHHSTTSSSTGRDSGRESMVIVQFIENGNYTFNPDDKDDDDYDRLLPPGEYEHLCTCTYGRVDSGDDVSFSEGSHLSTIRISDGSQVPTLDVLHLRERILQHTPPIDNKSQHRRSRSTNAISSFTLEDRSHAPRRRIQSTSGLDDDLSWSFGESIIRTLSRTGINLFNIENPTYESEIEINRTWPHLREKLQKLKMSQSMDDMDEAVFTDSGSSGNVLTQTYS